MRNVDGLKYFLEKTVWELLKAENLDVTKYSVAGGAVRDYLTGDKIKDIDIFCQDQAAEEALLKFLREKHKLLNENNLLGNFIVNERWFQVIKGKYGDMSTDDLIRSFDFTICGAMVQGNGEVRFLPTFFQDCLAKHLRINTINFPLSTLERMQKYIKKGYTACNGTLLTVAKAIQTVNFDNPAQDTLRFYPDGTPRFFGID